MWQMLAFVFLIFAPEESKDSMFWGSLGMGILWFLVVPKEDAK
jgi:hypothetical protein